MSRPSTLVEVEVEAKVEEDKEVVEAEIPTKTNNRSKSLMTQTTVNVEEEIFKVGGVKEDVEVIKGMMQMLVIMVAGIVAVQTTLQGISQHQIRAIDDNKITMHQAIIRMIQRGYLLCNIIL